MAQAGCGLPSPAARARPTFGSTFVSGSDAEGLRSVLLSRFNSERVARGIRQLAAAVKSATDGKALFTAFYGYLYELDWNLAGSGHLALRDILDDPNIDALVAPYSYRASRELGSSMAPHGPESSPRINNKLWIHEDDTPTHLDRLACGGDAGCVDLFTRASTLEESLRFVRRDAFAAALRGNMLYFMDLWNKGWYGHPTFPQDSQAIWAAIADVRQAIDQLQLEGGYRAQVAVLVDDVSASHFPVSGFGGRNAWAFSDTFLGGFRDQVALIGTPVRHYLLSDVLKASFPAHQIRLAILPNAFHLSAAVQAAIQSKLKRDGKTLLYVHAPALFDDSDTADANRVSQELGMQVARGSGALALTTRHVASATSYGLGIEVDPWFHVTDSAVAVLGRYSRNDLVALARKDLGTHRVVFSGSPGLPAQLLRQLAVEAGVHVFASAAGDAVDARGFALAIHAGHAGTKTVTLPLAAASVVANTPTGEQELCKACASVTVPMNHGETVLLRWTAASSPPPDPPPGNGPSAGPRHPSGLFRDGAGGFLGLGVEHCVFESGPHLFSCGFTQADYDSAPQRPAATLLTAFIGLCQCPPPRFYGLFREAVGGFISLKHGACSLTSTEHLNQCGYSQADYDAAPQSSTAALGPHLGVCACSDAPTAPAAPPPVPPPADGSSCAGKCGGKAQSCYCDADCASFGDCCSDYAAVCQP